jgi:hypothetical protein
MQIMSLEAHDPLGAAAVFIPAVDLDEASKGPQITIEFTQNSHHFSRDS